MFGRQGETTLVSMADDVHRGLGWPLWVEAGVSGADQRAFSLPTGTVTFLLSDVEGSTQRWEEAPEAMAVAIPRHYELLDAAIVAPWRCPTGGAGRG